MPNKGHVTSYWPVASATISASSTGPLVVVSATTRLGSGAGSGLGVEDLRVGGTVPSAMSVKTPAASPLTLGPGRFS